MIALHSIRPVLTESHLLNFGRYLEAGYLVRLHQDVMQYCYRSSNPTFGWQNMNTVGPERSPQHNARWITRAQRQIHQIEVIH